MRSILHHLILASAVMAPAALATNTAAAETIKVPFDFTVAGQTWAAGFYTVDQDRSANIVTLRSQDASKSYSFVLGTGAPDPTDAHVTLRFDNLSSTHALRSVQYGSRITAALDRSTKRNAYAPSRLSQGR